VKSMFVLCRKALVMSFPMSIFICISSTVAQKTVPMF
jgi:hypothetical protein